MKQEPAGPNLLILVLVLFGCTEEPPSAGWTVVDSGGIRIVESSRPLWDAASPWELGSEPDLVIGSEESGVQLYRVTDAAKLSNGELLVANAGTGEVLLFSATGELKASLGGEGDGPGEFRRLSDVTPTSGDTILAWESAGRGRASFTPDGALIEDREFHSDALPRFQNDFEPSSQGAMFFLVFDQGYESPETPGRSQQWLARVDSEASEIDTLSQWPGVLNRAVDIPSGSPMLGPVRSITALFSPTTVLFVGGNPERVVVGDGAEPVLSLLDLSGRETMRLRWNAVRRRASSTDFSIALEERLGSRPAAQRRAREEALSSFSKDRPVPVFAEVILDQVGHVWARGYRLPSDSVAQWQVFEPSGRWLGTLTLPPDLRVLEIGEDYLLGVRRDEFDVETVVEFPLERPGVSDLEPQ